MTVGFRGRLCRVLLLSLLILSFSTVASAEAWLSIQNKILDIVCQFKDVFATTATGVAALIMVIAGIQWVSSEADPGARKKAKTSMIQAMVGLIIISIADEIARLVLWVGCT